MIVRTKAIRGLLSLLVLCGVTLLGQSDGVPKHYHDLVPLGAEVFTVHGKHWRRSLTLLASAESPGFEGMTVRTASRLPALFTAEGAPIVHYPSRVAFRVTASFRDKLENAEPFSITAAGEPNEYLLKLRFRIVVFHGLRQTTVQPTAVEQIGVPAEEPYNERIYRVTADLGSVPILDRVVMYVLDPNGARLCKFHLDLM